MLGILYLLIAFFVGYYLLKKTLPVFINMTNIKSLYGQEIELARWMVELPAACLVGTLLMTWFTYIFAYIFRSTGKPMFFGNLVSILVFSALAFYFVNSEKGKYIVLISDLKAHGVIKLKSFLKQYRIELIFVVVVTTVMSYLIFHSFYIKDGIMHVGYSVYSDFGPHLAMIRSFSGGLNFPTEYPHFADGNVRYHFFFQFLAGNLEYLGVRLDWAFNLPSILAMVSFLMLLYSFAIMLLGKKWIGVLVTLFFMFRSSFAFFSFISDKKSLGQIISIIFVNETHIGKTPYEEWGLWAQKTFINQRHFSFGLGILLIVLMVLYPNFKKMVIALKSIARSLKNALDKVTSDDTEQKAEGEALNNSKSVMPLKITWMKEFLFKKNAWLPESYVRPIFIGIILGLATFWNGAVVIASLPVLFVMALMSKHRLEYFITAVITVILSFCQTSFFFGIDSPAVDPKLTIGFIAPRHDLPGILNYYVELLGLLTFVMFAGLMVSPKGIRWLALAFITPLLMATTLQLTPDVVVNHKYVIVSVVLLNVIAAGFLYKVFSIGKVFTTVIALILLLTMTITGFVDIITLNNIDKHTYTINVNNSTENWVINYTGPNEIFLTDIYVMHPILLAGRKLFYGWPYFAWSAGYKTDQRGEIQRQIYGGTDVQTVKRLVNENKIGYIVIDDGNRNSKDYKLNEELIKSNFKLVYKNEQDKLQIFKTN